jgi:hypothetical protein
MKLVNKKLVVDEISFLPELEVTVRIPLESTQDNIALDRDFYEKFGREFLGLIDE